MNTSTGDEYKNGYKVAGSYKYYQGPLMEHLEY